MGPFTKELSFCKNAAQVKGYVTAKTLILGKVFNELFFLTVFLPISHIAIQNAQFQS